MISKERWTEIKIIIKTRLLEFVGVIVSTSIGLIGQILLSNFYRLVDERFFAK